ncbi:MAG: hypothetical protein WB421_00505 [Terriglobales bacterium]
MHNKIAVVAICIAAFAMSAATQTAVTTSGTTSSGTVPVFNGAATVTNSPITVSGSNVGIGTTTPAAALHVSSPVVTTPNSEFTGNFLIQGTGTTRTPGLGSALGFVVPANTDGSNPWEQGRILVTPDNGNSGDASGRMYLQTRYLNGNGWNYQNNLVLTSNGSVGIGTIPTSLFSIGTGFQVNSYGQTSISTVAGGPIITGHELGGGYQYPAGIFQAITDNPTGASNYYYQGVTNGTTNFSVRADGLVSSASGYCIAGNCISSWPANVTSGSNQINQVNGNVGIGTINPGAALDVAGVINGRNFTIPEPGGSAQWALIGTFSGSQWGETIRITAYIHNGYNAFNGQDSTYEISFKTSNGVSVDPNGFAGNGSWYAVGFNNAIAPGSIKWVANAAGTSATSFNLYIYLPAYTHGSHYSVTVDQSASWANVGQLTSDPGDVGSNTVMIPAVGFNLPYGNVGIGTTNPVGMLSVGASSQFQVSSVGAVATPSITFTGANGGTQTTPWTGVLCGGDYAEDMRADQKKESYEPGDVLVLTSDDNSDVTKSVEPYSAMVAGIYATKPGVVGLRDAVAKSKDNVPMAMVGVVPTKVSAENGSIHKGDLLVTSSQRGYAMKGTDRNRMLGAVIGKAMGSLDSGTGVIEVLVTLQ